jgi:hypothetical protein
MWTKKPGLVPGFLLLELFNSLGFYHDDAPISFREVQS